MLYGIDYLCFLQFRNGICNISDSSPQNCYYKLLVIVPHKIVITSSDNSSQNYYYKLVYYKSQSLFVTNIQHKTEKIATIILKVYEENQIPSIIFFKSQPFWKCDNSSNVSPHVVTFWK